MKLLLTVTAVAAVLAHRFVVTADEKCPPGTARSDKPLACNAGDKPLEHPPGSKCWMCESLTRSCPKDYVKKDGICCKNGWHFPPAPSHCSSDQTLDHDENGCWKCTPCEAPYHVSSGHCCPNGQTWSTSEAFPAQPGKCCMKDHSLTVSKDGLHSSCCVTGATYENGKCIPPREPVTPPGPLTPRGPVTPPGHLCPATTDNCVACTACKHKPVCPDVATKSLGIEYGKCYVLETSSGKTVGRHPNGQYQAPGYYPDLPFRICDQLHQCDKKGPVGLKDTFTLEDVIGFQDWIDGMFNGAHGFFSHTGGHEAITVVPDFIAKFAGKPSCLDRRYGICIHVDGKGAGAVCPSDPMFFGTNNVNSKMCLRFVFKPVTCPDLADDFVLD